MTLKNEFYIGVKIGKKLEIFWIEVNKQEYNWFIRIYFTQTDFYWKKEEFDYRIELVTTKCN